MTVTPPTAQDQRIPPQVLAFSLGFSVLAAGFLFWLIYGNPSRGQFDASFLAPVNAGLNAASATCLFLGYRAIRRGDRTRHRTLMLGALGFSTLFLVSYIVYHYVHGDSVFVGDPTVRLVYLGILISHIVLSVVALPLILLTFSLSLTGRFALHKRWARWTFPIWSYVSVTGVLIFFLLKTLGQG